MNTIIQTTTTIPILPPRQASIHLEKWILLNEIRDGRVVYSTGKEMYFITRSSRWANGRLIVTLLEHGYLQEAGETPGVYVLSESGRRAWVAYTDELQSLVGRCDGCGQTSNVKPIVLTQECGRDAQWWNLLCADCRQVFACDELEAGAFVPALALEAA